MLSQDINTLQIAIPQLSTRSQSFAHSLCSQFKRKGYLSTAQLSYVAKLLAEANGLVVELAQATKPTSALGDYSAVILMFANAAKKLKYPKITLRLFHATEAHIYQDIRLSVAGMRSSKPGWINVTSADSYGDRDWYGRVSPDGVFEQGRAFDSTVSALLMPVLAELGTNPIQVVMKHGALTGNCCFCNLELTDERSKNAGFGAKCAANYGLTAEYKAATHRLPHEVK